MGSLKDLMKMVPGADKLPMDNVNDKEMHKMIAVVNSMSFEERDDIKLLNGSRKKRIAMGSGSTVVEVNQLIKQFSQMGKMMKMMQGDGGKQMMQIMKGKGGMPKM